MRNSSSKQIFKFGKRDCQRVASFIYGLILYFAQVPRGRFEDLAGRFVVESVMKGLELLASAAAFPLGGEANSENAPEAHAGFILRRESGLKPRFCEINLSRTSISPNWVPMASAISSTPNTATSIG
jgi:hypothetical protein